MRKIIISLVMALNLSLGGFAASEHLSRRAEVVAYLQANYPELARSLKNGTYKELKHFAPERFLLGKDIQKHFPNNTSFFKALLIGAELTEVSDPEYNFSFSDLSWSNFSFTDLRACDLTNSMAYRADMSHAVLECNKIRGADLRGTNLHGTRLLINGNERYVTKERLERCGAIIDDTSKISNPLKFTIRNMKGLMLLGKKSLEN